MRSARASVNEPFTCPKSSDSTTVGASAGMVTGMYARRPLSAAYARANSSLPVPVSPRSSTRAPALARRRSVSYAFSSAGAAPTIWWRRSSLCSASTRSSLRESASAVRARS